MTVPDVVDYSELTFDELLTRAEHIADTEFNGHLSVFRSLAGWTATFGTPTDLAVIQKLPDFVTLVDALRWVVAERPDPMDVSVELPQRRCVGTNRLGERCRNAPCAFQSVCHKHGGGSPQSQSKAKQRALALQEPSLAVAAKCLSSPNESIRLKAALALLDRTGFGPQATLNVNTAPALPEELRGLNDEQLAVRCEALSHQMRVLAERLRQRAAGVELLTLGPLTLDADVIHRAQSVLSPAGTTRSLDNPIDSNNLQEDVYRPVEAPPTGPIATTTGSPESDRGTNLVTLQTGQTRSNRPESTNTTD